MGYLGISHFSRLTSYPCSRDPYSFRSDAERVRMAARRGWPVPVLRVVARQRARRWEKRIRGDGPTLPVRVVVERRGISAIHRYPEDRVAFGGGGHRDPHHGVRRDQPTQHRRAAQALRGLADPQRRAGPRGHRSGHRVAQPPPAGHRVPGRRHRPVAGRCRAPGRRDAPGQSEHGHVQRARTGQLDREDERRHRPRESPRHHRCGRVRRRRQRLHRPLRAERRHHLVGRPGHGGRRRPVGGGRAG